MTQFDSFIHSDIAWNVCLSILYLPHKLVVTVLLTCRHAQIYQKREESIQPAPQNQ